MTPADRIALSERLARAMAWNGLETHEQETHLRRARGLLAELEKSREQLDRIGWILIEVPPDGAEVSE